MVIYDSILRDYLQRTIVMTADNKVFKEGKFLLFSQKDYYLNFFLRTEESEDIKKTEMPYPYKIFKTETGLVLDYCLSSISCGDDELYYRLVSLSKKASTRYYDKYVYISEKNILAFPTNDV